MNLRTSPPLATWFLNQFGAIHENDSAIGDLIEQYQRGRGSLWYWRQVLAIVFGGFYREFRRDKWRFLVEAFRIWCVWGGLQFLAWLFLLQRERSLHLIGWDGSDATPFPLLTLRIRTGNLDVWHFSLLLVILNILTLLLVGRSITVSSRIHPRLLLLAFLASFAAANTLSLLLSILMIVGDQPNAAGLLLTGLIAMPVVPALLVIGAGLSTHKPEETFGARRV